ncbi:sulfatase family protein [Maioricimonas rarisocia]|nr:arylsulfatase [Maioricimonas rarisocia]
MPVTDRRPSDAVAVPLEQSDAPHKRSLLALLLIAIVLTLALAGRSLAAQTDRPNIVVILADDMGYGDVRALNPDSAIPTPHLDRLPSEGMTFTDAHTPSAVCTPTRYGLVTGRYCWRTRLKRGVLNGYGEPLIDQDRVTVADFLAEQGYTTGIVGKWHLGLGFAKKDDGSFDFSQPVDDGPHTHGFEFSHVIPASLDFPPYLFIRNGKPTEFPSLTQQAQKFPAFLRKGERSRDFVMEDVLDDLQAEAAGFIKRQAKQEQPFFLYFPLTAPHKPVLPHPRFRGTTDLGPYGDFVTQVDATVGGVLDAIDEADVADNTLVLYTSDNGSFMYRYDDARKDHVDDESIQGYRAEHHRANGPLRGTKADIWEAGHRVPFFVRWPGQVEAGSRSDTTVCLTDVFMTLAQVIGAADEVPKSAAPDSYSFAAVLKGQTLERKRPPVVHHSVAGMFAVRDGRWKLVLGNGSGGRQRPKGKPFEKPYALFDLESDLGEQTNVIEQNPEVAKRLEEACQDLIDNEPRR